MGTGGIDYVFADSEGRKLGVDLEPLAADLAPSEPGPGRKVSGSLLVSSQ